MNLSQHGKPKCLCSAKNIGNCTQDWLSGETFATRFPNPSKNCKLSGNDVPSAACRENAAEDANSRLSGKTQIQIPDAAKPLLKVEFAVLFQIRKRPFCSLPFLKELELFGLETSALCLQTKPNGRIYFRAGGNVDAWVALFRLAPLFIETTKHWPSLLTTKHFHGFRPFSGFPAFIPESTKTHQAQRNKELNSQKLN